MKRLLAVGLVLGLSGLSTLSVLTVLSAAPADENWTGTISDDMCGASGHVRMRMGPTDAECTLACVDAHGAAYVLDDGKQNYVLSDQRTPQQFAGRKVKVTGTLDAKTKTIQVQSITAAD